MSTPLNPSMIPSGFTLIVMWISMIEASFDVFALMAKSSTCLEKYIFSSFIIWVMIESWLVLAWFEIYISNYFIG